MLKQPPLKPNTKPMLRHMPKPRRLSFLPQPTAKQLPPPPNLMLLPPSKNLILCSSMNTPILRTKTGRSLSPRLTCQKLSSPKDLPERKKRSRESVPSNKPPGKMPHPPIIDGDMLRHKSSTPWVKTSRHPHQTHGCMHLLLSPPRLLDIMFTLKTPCLTMSHIAEYEAQTDIIFI